MNDSLGYSFLQSKKNLVCRVIPNPDLYTEKTNFPCMTFLFVSYMDAFKNIYVEIKTLFQSKGLFEVYILKDNFSSEN